MLFFPALTALATDVRCLNGFCCAFTRPSACVCVCVCALFLSKYILKVKNHKMPKGFKSRVPKNPQHRAMDADLPLLEDLELRRCKADENVRLRKECPLSFAVSPVFLQDTRKQVGATCRWW